MNDRDHFAAAALTGLTACGDYSVESTPVLAYRMADAMLRQRANHIPDAGKMVETPRTPQSDRLAEWERHGSHRWGLGVASDLYDLECRVAALEKTIHDAAPAAKAVSDEARTDKAAPRPSEGTGNTNARLAALEQLSALDQKLELEYGLVGNPMIKAQEHMRSQNCCYCEKPHGKSFPLIFQSCDACQDARDKRAIDASNGLISVSCPRCDLQFSADATHALTDEEREAIKWAAVVSEGLCQMGAMNRARTLLGILERLG